MSPDSDGEFTRRTLTRTLGAVGAAGLAGCSGLFGGDDDGDGDGDGDGGSGDDGSPGDTGGSDGELGERVPTININYFTGTYQTRLAEVVAPNLQDTLDEGLGVDSEIQGKTVGTAVGEITGGNFTYHIFPWSAQTFPDRLDPNWIVRDAYRIDGAGSRNEAGISLNYGRYASCDYSIPAWEQEQAPDEETRRELVNEAITQLAEDYMSIPIYPQATFGAWDTTAVEMVDIGEFGVSNLNAFNILRSNPINGTEKVIGANIPDRWVALNPYQSPNPLSRLLIEYSTLITYGPDLDLQPYLAEDWEVSNNSQRFEFTLRDATFQNGDPITASDVQFTFEFLEENGGDLPGGLSPNLESVETPDEETVVINFPQPSLSFLTDAVVRIGILNENVWAEADGQAAEFNPPQGTASGPFAVTEFESTRRIELEVHTGHPEAPDPSEFDELVIRAFDSDQGMVQALGAGDIMQAPNMGFSDGQSAGELENVEVAPSLAHIPFTITPSYAQPPTKFREFRQAMGMSVNRQELIAVGLPGEDVEPEFSPRPFWRTHPWAAPADQLPTFTDDPTGDVEGARQVLTDAGWGWDDDGNLHYPPDADISPLWSDGEAPSPEEFPCLEQILGE